jgi:hypothetical protein
VKRFSEGERVLVRSGLLGREKSATVAADFHGIGGEKVLVLFEGKTKPRSVAPASVRSATARPALRVVPSSTATSSPRTSPSTLVSPSSPLPPPPPDPPVQLRAVPKAPLPDRDPRYLAFVRSHACCSCGSQEDVEAHHWARRGQKGLATKPSDFRTVPLCRRCHDTFHATGELPRMNGPQAKFWFLAKQADLLIAWIGELAAPKRARKERRS